MKVNNSVKIQDPPAQKSSDKGAKSLSKAEIEAKIKEKFGNIKKPKKKVEVEDKVEVTSKKGVNASGEKGFGDIGSNDPSGEDTQEKLRGILKAGAFHFSDKERRALGEILKK